MKVLFTTLCILTLLGIPFYVNAQKWQVDSYNIGYRISEISAVGNNPTTIAPLLKDPETYRKYLTTIRNNTLYGNPAILVVQTIYLNAELRKQHSQSRFWRKYTIQAGLNLTVPISQDAGAIGYQSYNNSLDTAKYVHMYSSKKIQQFAGANAGLNRRFILSHRFEIRAGIQAQGSFAVVHRYQQNWDSSTYTPSTGWMERISHLDDLKAKNFFQWQVMLPISIQYLFYKESFAFRVELTPGIIGSRYRPKSPSAREAHSAGLWLVYKPKMN